jgi:Glycosyltransferase like family 2
MNYSIVITTFDKRFETDLVPLITSIKSLRPEVEVILTVNGPAISRFDQDYRKKLCQLIAEFNMVYPTVFPTFQSLAKLWNRGILSSSNECILVLNDDLKIRAENGKSFFDCFESVLQSAPKTFVINGSFSHFVVNKREVIEVGFFDERLLGLGEEDGDFFWRYHEKFEKDIPDLKIDLIDNIHSDLADSGYIKGIRTASKFNRDFIKNHKYKEVLLGGYRGMFDKRVKKILPDECQYPYEVFSLENKKNL